MDPLTHEFLRSEASLSWAECSICGVPLVNHSHHKYHGYGGGDCMRCYQPEAGFIHERAQSQVV